MALGSTYQNQRGGYSSVEWQLNLGMALGNQEHLAYLKEENQAVRSNLRNVLESSSCNLEDLSRYVEGFNCPTIKIGSSDPGAPLLSKRRHLRSLQ